jgi:hypothetical protein
MGVTKVVRGGPTIPFEEPLCPWGRRGIMKSCEGGDGDDSKASELLGNTDISPSNLALAPL